MKAPTYIKCETDREAEAWTDVDINWFGGRFECVKIRISGNSFKERENGYIFPMLVSFWSRFGAKI